MQPNTLPAGEVGAVGRDELGLIVVVPDGDKTKRCLL